MMIPLLDLASDDDKVVARSGDELEACCCFLMHQGQRYLPITLSARRYDAMHAGVCICWMAACADSCLCAMAFAAAPNNAREMSRILLGIAVWPRKKQQMHRRHCMSLSDTKAEVQQCIGPAVVSIALELAKWHQPHKYASFASRTMLRADSLAYISLPKRLSTMKHLLNRSFAADASCCSSNLIIVNMPFTLLGSTRACKASVGVHHRLSEPAVADISFTGFHVGATDA